MKENILFLQDQIMCRKGESILALIITFENVHLLKQIATMVFLINTGTE